MTFERSLSALLSLVRIRSVFVKSVLDFSWLQPEQMGPRFLGS